MQLLPSWSSYYGHVLSFTLKSWASREISAVYEWSSWSSHAQRLPNENSATVHSLVCDVSCAAIKSHSIDLSGSTYVSCCACCKHIQLESSLLPVVYTWTCVQSSRNIWMYLLKIHGKYFFQRNEKINKQAYTHMCAMQSCYCAVRAGLPQ